MLNKIAELLRLNDSINKYKEMDNGLKKLVNKTWTIIMLGVLLIIGLTLYFGLYTPVGMTAVNIGVISLFIWIFGNLIYYAILSDKIAGCKDGEHVTMIIPAFKFLGIIIIVACAFGINVFLGFLIVFLILFFGYKKIKSLLNESNSDTDKKQ